MNKNFPVPGILLIAACILWLTGCNSQGEQAIQGKWGIGNVHYWAEWNFFGGSYTYSFDNGFTEISESGHYSIIETTDDYIDVELYNRKGGIREAMEESIDMRIQLSQDGTINIKGNTYYLVDDSSLQALQTAKAP